ncbi:MAG: hypothetical protein IPF93_14355 [Saprospiraceae bacterium]|nr:hypothetical protein [Saprospiraceae bacterium]
MKHHRYSLEPKVHFSPDEKQVIFRANFEGTTNVYAVEIEKKQLIISIVQLQASAGIG